MKKTFQYQLLANTKSCLCPTYDFSLSYEENCEAGPTFNGEFPDIGVETKYKFLDFEVNSPFGVAAGLLLNSKWVKCYSSLGFDILTYKTVRTHKNPSLPHPNCVYLDINGQLNAEVSHYPEISTSPPPKNIEEVSITNSLGMPSADPLEWQQDVKTAKNHLRNGQILVVSVVGSYDKNASLKDDFVHCAKLAKEAGADIIELNFSCPNSPTEEGEIYRDFELSSCISKLVKREIEDTPIFVKIGYLNRDLLADFTKYNAPFIQGIVAINTVKAIVVDQNGETVLPGRDRSGVCGSAIKMAGLEVAQNLIELREKNKYDFVVVGVGGCLVPQDAKDYYDIGVDAIESCTGAMFDPYLALKVHHYLKDGNYPSA